MRADHFADVGKMVRGKTERGDPLAVNIESEFMGEFDAIAGDVSRMKDEAAALVLLAILYFLAMIFGDSNE